MERRLFRSAIKLTFSSLNGTLKETANGDEWTRTKGETKTNRRWTQIHADKMSPLRSNQENLADVRGLDDAIAQRFAREINERHPEI